MSESNEWDMMIGCPPGKEPVTGPEYDELPENPRRYLELGLVSMFLEYQQARDEWSSNLPGPHYGPDGDSLNWEHAWISGDNVVLHDFKQAMNNAAVLLSACLGVPGRPYNLSLEDPIQSNEMPVDSNGKKPIDRLVQKLQEIDPIELMKSPLQDSLGNLPSAKYNSYVERMQDGIRRVKAERGWDW